MRETKKKQIKKKVNEFFKTLKPILIFSFIINLILLGYIYFIKNSSHIYLFSGSNEYLNIKSGSMSLNYDINYLMGNNITFNGEKDLKIKEIKIGYYVTNAENLIEIITHYETFEESESLKKVLDNITNLNVSENSKDNKIFKNNIKDVENNLYLIMEIKTDASEKIISKLQLDVSKLK